MPAGPRPDGARRPAARWDSGGGGLRRSFRPWGRRVRNRRPGRAGRAARPGRPVLPGLAVRGDASLLDRYFVLVPPL